MKQQKCNYFPSLWWRGREKGLSTFLFLLLFSISLHAQRQDILLNNNWNFRFSHQVQGDTRRVDLPHTWNAQDALAGKIDYKRGIGNYEKALYIRPEWKGKRLFLRFDGVNSIADVFINRKHIGEHRGGYGAFIFEITDLVKYGEKNSVLVRANNGEQLDIMPLVGDFNFYGGIYRDVHLLITDETCISPLDYASPGVYLVQEVVSPQEAKVCAKVNLSNRAADGTAELQVLVTDGTKVICKESRNVSLKQGADIQEQLPLLIQKPRLWNGCEDPFMYQVSISLHKDGKQIDSVTQPLGLRYYHTDPDKGFFLNGKHLPLHGVCRHQDRAEVGNALRPQHHEEDVALMREMGVNAIRLAHYPQATYMYDLMDKHGIVTWAEIPFVGPGGYADKGFVDQASFRENGKQQLIELIRQHYNHPSICFWGLFNELKEVGDNPVEYVKELNQEIFLQDAFSYGGALNQNQANEDQVMKRMQKKIDAGLSWFMTQPIYSDEEVEKLGRMKQELNTKILCGIMPLVSYRNAMFIKNEMPGIQVPDEIVAQYRPDMSRAEAEDVAVRISLSIMEKLEEVADGFYFMTPFNRVSLITRIIHARKPQ